jgi:ABC-type sugar transport system ATPase subunit
VAELAEPLRLGSLLDRKPETLSGGEQQRVALGRALIARPRVLLLDEPLASLDPFARAELRSVIRSVQRQFRVTTLYVTHDQAEAAALADRIALLREGVLQQFAPARELYNDPRNLFVARFFGTDGLNLLKAQLVPNGAGWCAQVGDTPFPLARKPARTAGDLCLAFRPSAVRIRRSELGPWRIEEIQDNGWTTSLHLSSAEHRITAVSSIEEHPYNAGDRVDVAVEPARTLVFDSHTGERLA